jgi:hypothetical protein
VHNTCVGVVFWLLGLLVPLFRLAIASRIFFMLMKEKETKKSSKTAFQKILNYLLFEDFKTPLFSSEYENLSENFIKYNKPGAIFNEALNIELSDIFEEILVDLSYNDRTEIIDTLLKDKDSYDGLLYVFTLEVHRKFKNINEDIPSQFLKMLLHYQSENQLNIFLMVYFKQYFYKLYETKFSKYSQISEQEYKIILEKFMTKKSSLD